VMASATASAATVKTAAVEPQAEVSAAATASGKFHVQTVTYTSKAAAEQQLKLLSQKGYFGKILPRGKYQQVCVGGFETREQATQIMGQLKTSGLAPKDAYIRTLG
jgi:cell division septation protein DedD